MTRAVMVYEWYRPEGAAYNEPFQRREVGAANFHQFGMDYEQFEDGVGNYSTAIVEMPDGEVRNVPVELIRFKKD